MTKLLQMDDYTSQARTYWWVATVLGLAALAVSIVGLTRLSPAMLTVALSGAVFAAMTGLVPVTIAGSKTSVSVAEIFVFLLLLGVGPDAAVVAAAAEAACISLRTSKRPTSWIASPAMAAIAMWIASHLFIWLLASLPASGNTALVARIVLLLGAAALYFSLGTVLIASLIKLKRGEAVRPLSIIGDHAWLGLGYACSAAIAALLQSSFAGPFEVSIALLAVLFTVALLAMMHLYYGRVIPQQR